MESQKCTLNKIVLVSKPCITEEGKKTIVYLILICDINNS